MWYQSGTVSVTADSATVTGTGTQWVQWTRVGDAFQGPDGRLYEITNVASDTAIAISPPYLGPTAAGQAYTVIPVQGYTKRLADKAAQLIGDYGEAEQMARTALQQGQNLADLDDAATARENLGLVAATQAEVNAASAQDEAKFVTPKTLWGWTKQATEAVFGLAKVATQAQTNAGTDDATFITPKKLRWGVAYSLTRTGYLILPQWLGGFILQWGEGNAVNADISATWPTPFTAAPYFVLASCTTAQSVAVVVSATDYTTTGTGLRFRNSIGGVNGIWYSYFSFGR